MTRFVGAPDGVQVAAHELGGDGHPLVLAHAAGFHGLVFAPLAAGLGAAFRCVSLDERGHGDSPLPAGVALDWQGLAADVLAVVDGLGLDRPFGFGHSSGGTAVLLAELARPGTFRGIYCFEPILIPPGDTGGEGLGSKLAAQARRRRASFPSRDAALAHYSSRPPFASFTPAALRAYVEHGFESDGSEARLKCRPEVEAAVYETATAHDALDHLGDVSCPVTVACGALTPGCSGGRPFAFEDRMPSGRGEVVAGVGHFGPMERPDVVGDSVREAFAGRG